MHLGLKLGLAARRGGGGGSLLSLLQNSTAGFFYPVETTRLFQDDSDVSSSQYVLSDSDPIGLHVDAMAGVTVTETLGAELWDNDAAAVTGAASQVSPGVYDFNWTGGAAAQVEVANVLDAGSVYLVDFSISNYVSGSLAVSLQAFENGGSYSAAGDYQAYAVAASGDDIHFDRSGSTGQFRLTVNSVREVIRTFDGLGPELVTNGGFDTDSDWTSSNASAAISGGQLVITSTPSTVGVFEDIGALSAGVAYLIEYDVPSLSAGSFFMSLADDGVGSNAAVGITRTAAGSYSEILIANSGNDTLCIRIGAGTTCSIDNVSVRELPGLHATQATSADRPLWDETEEAWELDGVSDHIVTGAATSAGSTATFGVSVKSTDSIAILNSREGAGGGFIRWQNAATNALDSADYFVDGVQIFNATRDEMHALLADGEWHFPEARNLDATLLISGMAIGRGGTGGPFLEGFLSDAYLTDLTAEADLNAIADAAMSERGITNLRNKTAEEVTQEATDGNLYGSPTASDNDPIATLPATVGDIDFTQSTSGDRPAFDAATGLLDFDGVSDHLTADLTGISDRSDMYFACLVETTDTSFYILGGSQTTLGGVYINDGDAGASLVSMAGSLFADTSPLSAPTRDEMHTSLADGSLHLFEYIGDLSNIRFSNIFFGFAFGAGGRLDGLGLPLYLGPDPGILQRNILRKRWLADFPDLSY